MSDNETAEMPAYRERIWPGLIAAAAIVGFAATLAVAYGAAYGSRIGWLTLGCVIAACALVMLPATPLIDVTQTHLRVGRAHIERRFLGECVVVPRARLAQLKREQEFATAYWAVPPWVRCAVVVSVTDPQDPHPLWVIGTRRADQLNHALAGQSVGR